MRPLELELRNFRSYFGETGRFNFRNRGLVGVVGPIGSGKSSMLDAISFALYGKTPTASTKTRTLIHQRTDNAAVRFRFSVDNDIWEVVRSIRSKGTAQHALYRLEDDTEDAEHVETITQAKDVNARIEELLGLDYDAFGRSVLLAQGRFAEFLTAGPTERDAVLKGVFGHDRIGRMRDEAKRLFDAVQHQLELVVARTEQLETVAARLAATTVEHTAVQARMASLEKAAPKLTELDTAIAEQSVKRAEAQQRIESLGSADILPKPNEVDSVLAAAKSAEGQRNRLGEDIKKAGEEAASADTAVAEWTATNEEALSEADALLGAFEPTRVRRNQLTNQLAALEREHTETTNAIAATTQERTKAEAAMTTVVAGVADAEAALEKAHLSLHTAQRANMANTLRSSLESGDTCPVCSQVMTTLEPSSMPVDVEVAEQEVATKTAMRNETEQRRAQSQAAVSRLEASVASATTAMERLDARRSEHETALAAATAEIDRIEAALVKALGSGDPAALIAARRQERAALVDTLQQSKTALERIRQLHDTAMRDQQETQRQVSGLVTSLATAADRLAVPLEVEPDDLDAVQRHADGLRTRWETAADEHRKALETAAAALDQLSIKRRTLLDPLQLSQSLAEELSAVRASYTHLDAALVRDRTEVEAGAALLEEKAKLEADAAVYKQLVDDLRDSGFVRFLLDEDRTRLARLGTEHFLRLSSGRYEFSNDGAFNIVDLTAADALRTASSLSGGETFLASLALALALAEMVARTGGRLDAFFLDEGFGSLDAEHLDLAMEGIEALVNERSDRLVVVVSHVPDLRNRIEDLIELDKDPLTGDTKVLSA